LTGQTKSESVGGMLREPNIPEILRYRRTGAEFLGFIMRPGWRGELPYYRFKCTVHGYVDGYPHGYNKELVCPYCEQGEE